MWIWSFMVNQYALIIYLNCNPTDANQQEVISNQQGVSKIKVCIQAAPYFFCAIFFPMRTQLWASLSGIQDLGSLL